MIGQPLNRVDGPLKVTGRATYAYEHWERSASRCTASSSARRSARAASRDRHARAEQAPGVRLVMTHRNAPAQGTRRPVGSDRILARVSRC